MQHGPAASSGSNPKAPGSAGGYLLVWMRASTSIPAAVGVAIALIFDLYVHYHVFIHPRSSTVGLAMIFAPLWKRFAVLPSRNASYLVGGSTTRKYSRKCLGLQC
jgi:hypothetical protein